MSFTPSLRLRLIGLFVLTALVVAAVIIFAVERFSAAADHPAVADLLADGHQRGRARSCARIERAAPAGRTRSPMRVRQTPASSRRIMP